MCSLQYRFGTAHGLGLFEKYWLLWNKTSEAAGQVSLPVMPNCRRYAAKQTDMIMWSCQPRAQTSCQSHHCRKTWPKGLFTFSQCCIGDSNSRPPDLKLGAITKWLASLSITAGFSTHLGFSRINHVIARAFRAKDNVIGWLPCLGARQLPDPRCERCSAPGVRCSLPAERSAAPPQSS